MFPPSRGYVRTLHRRLVAALLALGRPLRCEVEPCHLGAPEVFQPGELVVESRGGDTPDQLYLAHRGCARAAQVYAERQERAAMRASLRALTELPTDIYGRAIFKEESQ